MKTSDQTDELAKALRLFQSAVPAVVKDKTAKVPTKNGGQYSYTYADLGSIIETTTTTLDAFGLSVSQETQGDSTGVFLTTRLLHDSGQWLEAGPLFLPVEGNAQAFGSAITYGRRYQLTAILGIATEDDDDAQTSQGRSAPSSPRNGASPATPPAEGTAAPRSERPANRSGEGVESGRKVTGEGTIASAPSSPEPPSPAVEASEGPPAAGGTPKQRLFSHFGTVPKIKAAYEGKYGEGTFTTVADITALEADEMLGVG